MRTLVPVLLSLALATSACDDDGGGGDGGGMDAGARDGGSTGDDDAGDPDTDAGEPSGGVDCSDPDPAWLLCEDFETGGGDFDAWFAGSDFVTSVGQDDRDRITLSGDQPHSGSYALHMPGNTPQFLGGDVGWVSCEGGQATNCTPRNHEQLYMRAYIRFAPDNDYVHHFLSVGGRDRFWAYGSAGCLPNGVSEMGTTVDFREDSHESFFYTYHLDMSCDERCERYADEAARCAECAMKGFPTCDSVGQCCWGNHYEADTPVAFPVGEWFCFEMMMRPNAPGSSDGEMAYWVNDALAHEQGGMRFRTTGDLGMNRATVANYVAAGDTDQPQRVWFDDVVISTERIGCGNP